MKKYKIKLLMFLVLTLTLSTGCSNKTELELTTENPIVKTPDEAPTETSSEIVNLNNNAVVVVNDETVDIEIYNIYYAMYEFAYKDEKNYADYLRDFTLNSLVDEALIRSYVFSTGFTISDELFATEYDEVLKNIMGNEEMKSFYESIGVTRGFLERAVQSNIILEEFARINNGFIDSDYEKKINELKAVGNIKIFTEKVTSKTPQVVSNETVSQKNAINKAKSYLWSSPFSRNELISKLAYEGIFNDDAIYAADNCGADWNEEAFRCINIMSDYVVLENKISSLEFHGFTREQILYAIEASGLSLEGEFWCKGKSDTPYGCHNKTTNVFDLYCDDCDPNGDGIED